MEILRQIFLFVEHISWGLPKKTARFSTEVAIISTTFVNFIIEISVEAVLQIYYRFYFQENDTIVVKTQVI